MGVSDTDLQQPPFPPQVGGMLSRSFPSLPFLFHAPTDCLEFVSAPYATSEHDLDTSR